MIFNETIGLNIPMKSKIHPHQIINIQWRITN